MIENIHSISQTRVLEKYFSQSFKLNITIAFSFNNKKNDLQNISTSFKANKLLLNFSKTKYSLFYFQNKKSEIPRHLPSLKINNTLVEQGKTSKILGVVFGENLLWKPHLDVLASKISKYIVAIFRFCCYINKKLLKQLYFFYTQLNRLCKHYMGKYASLKARNVASSPKTCSQSHKL